MISTLPITNGFYQSNSLPVSAQECTNWYVNVPQAPALSERQLFGTPGMAMAATSGEDPTDANRGGREMAGVAYFVNGGYLYRLNSDETLDTLGAISGTGRVSMSDNGTQLCILDPGGSGYIFTAPSTLTEITDVDFRANGDPQHVWFVDGYFVFSTDENKFILSALYDGLAYNALDYSSAESSPDGVTTPLVFSNQLFIIGEITAEGFNNTGNIDFPFQRSGLFLNQGSTAPFSVVVTPQSFMFIGGGKNETPSVYQFANNDTVKISTNAIDEILQDLTPDEVTEVYGWTYAQSGHYFVGWTLPNTAIVFDTTTGLWHERKSQYPGPDLVPISTAYRASSFVKAYGKLYAGDAVDGRIGIVSPDTFYEYDNFIIRRASTQPFHNRMMPFFVPYLELVLESGVGNDDDTDPYIMLERSLDGGKTWRAPRERAIGKVGEYNRRAVWRKNGLVRRFDVYRFTLSAPVKPVIIALYMDPVGVQSVAA